MKHLYIIRHGQSEANAQHIVAGFYNSPLSDLGRLQAKLAGQNAKRFFHFDLLVSSPMKRAFETATIVAAELNFSAEKIMTLEDLRERNLGEREGTLASANQQYSGNYEDVENTPGIEPIEAVYARAKQVLDQLRQRPEEVILATTHNGLGRMLETVVSGGEPLELYAQARLEHAIIYKCL